jgi:hypothetical protein
VDRSATRVAFWLVASMILSCHSVGKAGYPLYPQTGVRPTPDQIATLVGPIGTVDGVNVSLKGKTFELLPGCHIATLERNIGAGGDNGAWAANLPPITFAFEMKPAHFYKIIIDLQESSAPVGRIRITARETAPDGSSVRLGNARSTADIQDCRNWAIAARL